MNIILKDEYTQLHDELIVNKFDLNRRYLFSNYKNKHE